MVGEKEIDIDSASVAVVGAGHAFEMIEGERLQGYLDSVEVSHHLVNEPNKYNTSQSCTRLLLDAWRVQLRVSRATET